MEWPNSDWCTVCNWGKQSSYSGLEWIKRDWRKIIKFGKDTDDDSTRSNEEYARLMVHGICIGVAYGFIVGMGLMMCWAHFSRVRSHERQQKASNMAALAAMQLDDVRKFFPQEYFPYWIVMGQYEKVHWINHCVRKAWPFYTKSQSEIMKEAWEPWIDPYRPASISQLSFQKLTLGSIPPVLLGVRMVSATREEITMNVECQWQGNPSIILRVRTTLGLTFQIQIKDVSMLVVLRIIFRPLVNELPGFGAFTFSIEKNKKLDFTLKLIGGDISTIPGLGSSVEQMIKTSFLDTLMWPMRIPVPIIPSPVDRDNSRLQRHFNPRRGAIMYSAPGTLKVQAAGILDIKMVQARDLKTLNESGNVAIFALVYIRQMPRLMKRSTTISNSMYPIWNEMYELEVEDPEIQRLVVKILDERGDQESESLGSCQIILKDLEPGVLSDKWIGLVKTLGTEDAKYRGEVNLELLYRPYDSQCMLNSDGVHEDSGSMPVSPESRSGSYRASISFSEDNRSRQADKTIALHPLFSYKGQLWEVLRGALSVTVERAESLVPQGVSGLRDAYVVLKMRKSKSRKETRVIYNNLNPEWNQTFDFLSEDGIHDMLHIKVWDQKLFGKESLGEYGITLTRAICDCEHKVNFKLNGVSTGLLFLTIKWTSQP